jgi:hypothetical protein
VTERSGQSSGGRVPTEKQHRALLTLAAAERVAAAGIIVAPAYTEHIGHYLQAWLAERQAEAA